MGSRSVLDRVCMLSDTHLIRQLTPAVGATYPCVLHDTNLPVGDQVSVVREYTKCSSEYWDDCTTGR